MVLQSQKLHFRVRSVANRLHIIFVQSVRILVSPVLWLVAATTVSSFESVIESIVQWASIWGSRLGFAQCVIGVGERFKWTPLCHQASIPTSYFSVVIEPS